MKEIEVREVRGQEMLDIMYSIPAYSLNPTPPMPDKEERQDILRRRKGASYFALFENGVPVACAASTLFIQNVRSALLPMGGIWGVATQPGSRRKGYQRQIFRELFRSIRDMGQSVSCLYPFRGSFYERLGYVTFPVPRKVSFDPVCLQSIAKHETDADNELVLIGDGFDIYRAFLMKIQAEKHGMGLFNEVELLPNQKQSQWLLITRFENQVEGIMLYDLKGDYPTVYKLRATRFYYTTSRAKYSQLSWLASHIDQANNIEINLEPTEYPETWLADLRGKIEPVFFAPMGRVVDIAGLRGLSVGSGEITVKIIDPECPWNNGIWRFASEDGRLSVSEGGTPGCTLTINGLSALIYGTHDPADFQFLGWGDPSPEMCSKMSRLAPKMVPYLHEMF